MGANAIRACALVLTFAAGAAAQAPDPDPSSREALIAEAQAAKAAALHPYVPNKVEQYVDYAESYLTTGLTFHPFFESAYSGGGFTLGAGYRRFVSGYNSIDVRGSVTFSGYTRVEAEFLAPRLAARQLRFSAVGGWRDATGVGFYGIGMANTTEDRVHYGFTQPYGRGTLTFRPGRRFVVLEGQVEASTWHQTSGSGGDEASVDDVYTPATLPGQGATVHYLHPQGTAALDWRPAPDYARRGGLLAVTYNRFDDPDHAFGFSRVDYEAIEHIPVLRDAWVLSLHGAVSTATAGGDQQIPFFMLPSIGGGSSLRGYSSWRFRDRNLLLLQADWRVIVNRFVDLALFADAGKVTHSAGDLNFDGLKTDWGAGVRFHGPMTTPLRIDLAYGSEGFRVVWSSSSSF